MNQVRIEVGTGFAGVKERTLDAIGRAKVGLKVQETTLTFVSWDVFISVMSSERLNLLRTLHHTPHHSVAALTSALGRPLEGVNSDVEALVEAGLIEKGEHGLRARYDRIEAAITL